MCLKLVPKKSPTVELDGPLTIIIDRVGTERISLFTYKYGEIDAAYRPIAPHELNKFISQICDNPLE